MQHDALQDLVLSGVKWEISEYPFATAAAVAAATIKSAPVVNNAPESQSSVSVEPVRRPISVVPPIAPVAAISVDTAAAMASRPGDVDTLNRMIAEFNHPLRSGATNVVLPHVAKNPSGVVIVTDVPGADDDASGVVLNPSSPAGELLDKMMGAIGLGRDTVSILPIIFWRTPGGRAPTSDEMELARPFMMRALELLNPKFILTLGTLPASAVLGRTLPREHGAIVETDKGIKSMPIFHPNYLILKPTAKRDAWDALQNMQKLLKSL